MEAVTGPVAARAALRDSLLLKRLLVIGAAGWETKFALAALEERGWEVDAHIAVSPRSDMRQGSIAAIDTARYSAVLALDSTAARYADRIARFVRSGGGLVLWSPATAVRSLAALAPGATRGTLIEDSGRPLHDALPRAELELLPITQLVKDAVVLERRDGGAVAVAARRVGPGRVLQTGYTNSWRWRLAGGDDAPERHRAWLASLVSRVAYAGRAEIATSPTAVAPLAALIDRLGAASAPLAAPPRDPAALLPWVFAAIALALLAEWASRRLRGAR